MNSLINTKLYSYADDLYMLTNPLSQNRAYTKLLLLSTQHNLPLNNAKTQTHYNTNNLYMNNPTNYKPKSEFMILGISLEELLNPSIITNNIIINKSN